MRKRKRKRGRGGSGGGLGWVDKAALKGWCKSRDRDDLLDRVVFIWNESHVGSSYVSYEDTFFRGLDCWMLKGRHNMNACKTSDYIPRKSLNRRRYQKRSPECKFVTAEMVIWN